MMELKRCSAVGRTHLGRADKMAGDYRQKDARTRLVARRRSPRVPDSELIDETLADVRDSVDRRGGLSEDEANRVVSDEVQRMRAEKRAAAWVARRR